MTTNWEADSDKSDVTMSQRGYAQLSPEQYRNEKLLKSSVGRKNELHTGGAVCAYGSLPGKFYGSQRKQARHRWSQRELVNEKDPED